MPKADLILADDITGYADESDRHHKNLSERLLPAGGNGDGDNAYYKLSALCILLFPGLGGFLFGYDIGATSAVLPQLKSAQYSGTQWHDLVNDNAYVEGVITSTVLVGGMIGSMICFSVANSLGRKCELMVGAALYAVGSLVEYFSAIPTLDATWGLTILLVGRLVYGIACGFSMHGAPAYIGEMAPSAIRGLLVSAKEACIVLGIMSGFAVGYVFSEREGDWKYTYGAAVPFALIMYAGTRRE